MVVDYKARKNEVLESYSKLEELIADLQDYSKNVELPDPVETKTMNALLRDIRGKAERVKEDRFNIMVAGEAKSGKSTFINAYLGVELLPMDVKQCTSAIVKIKYGDTFKVIATYAGGRKETITGDEEARKFLKENAALDDEYRDIPVPTINSEILVKSGRRAMEKGSTISIQKSEVQAMLDSPEVQAANIYGLPDYNERIKAYIEERKNTWEEIVTKIEIFFPFVEDLKGIEIIDSPGVCTRGGVSEITSQYIKNADAVIFLKPVIGQSLESAQFSQFMENASVERNKNALFLILTHIATKNEADIRRLEEEAHKQFLKKIDESHILFVDSKAELYSQQLADVECLEDELRILKKEGTLDSFVVDVYEETHGLFGTGEDFIKKLHDKSRFAVFYNALELFGRCAHYLLLAELLDSMNKMYAKLWNDTNYRIELFRQKAEDPTELARKIGIVKQELDIIQNKLSKGTDDVVRRFRGDKDNVGIIRREAEAAVTDFLDSVGKISPKANDAFEQLEKVSLAKIDQFVNLSEQLQKQVVDECDKELIELTDKSTIHYESIKPDFTEETFKKIKDETKSKATETGAFEEGLTFKKTHTYSHYKQNDHFEFIKNNIQSRLEILKNDLIENLEEFIENIRTTYINALAVNANAKKDELDKIMEAKKTAEQMQEIISTLTIKSKNIQEDEKTVEKIRGGIFKYVQR